MTEFRKREFIQFLLDNCVVCFFDEPITLKSGRKSHWYINWRTVSGDVSLIDRLADFLIAFTADMGFEPDAFYGVPEGATKIGIIATYKLAKSSGDIAPGEYHLPMGRGGTKDHGAPEDRYFVTAPRGKVVVVEDVTTTGSSLLAALDHLKEVGAQAIAAIGITNRMERRDDGKGVAEAIAERGVKYCALSEAIDFLPEAYRKFRPDERIARAVEEEFERYGSMPLKLLEGA